MNKQPQNRILKLLTTTMFFWLLFFINLVLPKVLKNFEINPFLWNLIYIILLVVALVASLVLIAESFKREKPFG